jgi:cytochrome c5
VSNPVTKTDLVFLRHFAMLIGGLAVTALLLIVLAAHIYGGHPSPGNPGAEEATLARIAPVGGVYAGDTGQAAMLAAREAAAKAAASQVAYGGTTDGKTIFDNLCHACHETGAGGAPRISDKVTWAPRVAEGLETLIRHATDGYTGSNGIMPPKGGNPALTDEQIKATVEWMINQVK